MDRVARGAALLLILCGCPSQQTPVVSSDGGGVSTSTTAALPSKRGGRLAAIQGLLAQDPESQTRAHQLYPLVEPICASDSERSTFAAEVVNEASVILDPGGDRRIRSLDTLEHVATACARNNLPAARELLGLVAAKLPKEHRIAELESRLSAAAGDLDGALAASERARSLGSNHAIPLIATIQAQNARAKSVGYRPGMLDEAIATVSVEPDHGWKLIDVTALLMTRARLLGERAIWEGPEERKKSVLLTLELYERLSRQPFIEKTRTHAVDMLCFEGTVFDADAHKRCRRAADESSILGAAFLLGEIQDPKRFDLQRMVKIGDVAQRIEKLPEKSLVLLVGRGDESELVTWVRPAAEVISWIGAKKPNLVLLDRTKGARAGALLDRIPELAGVKVAERIDAEKDTFAMPCVAALAANRQTPASCPFDKTLEQKLLKMQPFGVAILVGRDLDAEIEDLRLYDLPGALLSVRQPATEKVFAEHLKSVSDVFMLSKRGEPRWVELRRK